MPKSVKIIGLVAILLMVLGVGAFLYLTRPVVAPSIDFTKTGNTTPLISFGPTTPAINPSSTTPTGNQYFRIVSSDSTARFEINEVLRDSPYHVVGITNQIKGDLSLNMNTPAKSKLGTILVNARTLATDDDRRNGALGRYILHSEDSANEFIKFEPKTLTGLPEKIVVGKALSFKISGPLTISGVTRAVTFNATTTLVSNTKLIGSAEAIVKYADFGISIPEVSFVARVENSVLLKINIVANQVRAE